MAQVKILKDMAGSGNLELGQGPFVFKAGQITHVHNAIAKQWEADGHVEILHMDTAAPVVELDTAGNLTRTLDDESGLPLHRHASESEVRDALNRPLVGDPDIVSTPPFNKHDTRDDKGNLVHPAGVRDASGNLVKATDTVETGIIVEHSDRVETGVDTRPNPLNPPSQTAQMNPAQTVTTATDNPVIVDHSKDKP